MLTRYLKLRGPVLVVVVLIGCFTDLALKGFSDDQLKLVRRWKSSAFLSYIRPRVVFV